MTKPPLRAVGPCEYTGTCRELPENFADYPESIADRRSDLSNSCTDWSPRDALINMLRDIDSGKIKTDVICICYRKEHDDGTAPTTSFCISSKDGHVTIGVVHVVLDHLTRLATGLVATLVTLPIWQFITETPL
jgi:hypothetical protein